MNFYKTVFGWTFTKWDGPFDYWLIQTGNEDQPGIDGGLSKTDGPGMMTSITIDTDDIERTIQLIKENGGMLVGEKNTIPGVGWHIIFKDSEGNQLGAMQSDPIAQ